MNRTRIKICGMTRDDDVRLAVDLGADAIGLIFAKASPRCIDIDTAARLRKLVPAFVSLVGVFVDSDLETISEVRDRAGLDLVQLHGNETEEFAASLNAPYIKAIRVRSTQQLSTQLNAFPSAKALLLDPYVQGHHGGTGQQLDLSLWPKNRSQFHSGQDSQTYQPIILAGGLSPDNVVDAVAATQAYAIDLSSGVESKPGVKSASKMVDLFKAITAKEC